MTLSEWFEGRVVGVEVEGNGDRVPFTGRILVETITAKLNRQEWFDVELHSQLEYDEDFNGLRWPLVKLRHRPRVDDPVLVVFHEGKPVCWAWRNRRSTRVRARSETDRLTRHTQ